MEDRNSFGILGLVAFAVLASWAASIANKAFVVIGHAMDSLTSMMVSLIESLLRILEFAVVGSLIIGAVVGVVYFTIKYMAMVKRGTEIQRRVGEQLNEFQYNLDGRLQSFQSNVQTRMSHVERTLHDALKEPEVTPESSAPKQLPTPTNESKEIAPRLKDTNDEPPESQPF